MAQFKIITFLTDWLITHIKHEDIKLAALIHTSAKS